MASRILGFGRDVLIAGVLGTGPAADGFFIALRLPNLVRRTVGEGGLNAGFVPVHSRLARQAGEGAARRFSGEALAAAGLAALALTAVAEVFAPWLVLALAPGFVDEPAAWNLGSLYARLALPFIVVATLASIIAARLNAEHRYAAAALAPAGVNLAMIAAIVVIIHAVPEPARAGSWLATIFTLGGAVQLAGLALAARRLPGGIGLAPPKLSPDVRRLLALGLPALVASTAAQVCLLVASQVASWTPSGVSWFSYADRVFQLPLSLVGVGMGVVLLSELAAASAAGREIRYALNRGLEAALALTLPAAAALVVLAGPIATVLFERGAFGPQDSAGTAAALTGLAFGLPAGAVSKVLSQAFFARGDVRLPLIAGGLAVVATLAGALALAPLFGIGGVAGGASLGLDVHALVLVVALRRRKIWATDARLRQRLPRLLAASLIMAGTLHGLCLALAVPPVGPPAALRLAGLCLTGLAIFVAAAWGLGGLRRDDLNALTGGA